MTTPDTVTLPVDSLEQQFSTLLQRGGVLGDALDLTADEYEALYTLGHRFYEQAQYSPAFKVFALLVQYNPLESRYLMALGAAAQMLGRHEDALQQYVAATISRLDDPTPPFHAAECLVAMERFTEAAESLDLAEALSGPQHDVLRQRIATLRQQLPAPSTPTSRPSV